MKIKRFASLEEIKADWLAVERLVKPTPFSCWWWQNTFAKNFSAVKDLLLLGIYEQNIPVAMAGFERQNDLVFFLGMKPVLGGQELTDFGDLLTLEKTDVVWQTVIKYLSEQGVKSLIMDYVRQDSQTYGYFQKINNPLISIKKQQVSPFIKLPKTWEEYLVVLEGHKRRELRRKIKRLEANNGFVFCTSLSSEKDFKEFIRLHQLSDPAKEKFMSKKMAAFFYDLLTVEKKDWQAKICFLEIDKKRVAAMFFFAGKEKMLMYNSGFDPAYSYFSVGLVLSAYLIKRGTEEKFKIVDFLRGRERYKYDLGSKDHQLYQIKINL